MRIYNTQTRTKEEFVPREPGKVAMYVCGPTVYNYIHIGNARTFVSFDVIRRYLMYRGYDVRFVQNVTDVDDKIINRANQEGRSASEVAEEYTAAFIDVMHGLNVLDPTVRPRATQEIPEMIALVQELIDKGHAYEQDGSVYFAVRSFPAYGKLSGRDIDELRGGERDLHGGSFESEKRDPLDFALWKAAKPGEPSWDSPWGAGRPGWHIECSAMSSKYLGLPLDIHGGGNDLVFPHHENEVAQSEASSGCTFSNYWMHGGMLLIDSEKMSKSLGNFLLAKDVIAAHDPNVVRLLMAQTHYRSPMDYSVERLKEAAASYERIATSVRNLLWTSNHMKDDDAKGDAESREIVRKLTNDATDAHERFIAEMDDDFNTAGALGVIFALVSEANTALEELQKKPGYLSKNALFFAAETITELLAVLGIRLPAPPAADAWPYQVIDLAAEVVGYQGKDSHEAVDALLEARAAARKAKNWAVADAVRNGLTQLGFLIEDTPAGARVTYKG